MQSNTVAVFGNQADSMSEKRNRNPEIEKLLNERLAYQEEIDALVHQVGDAYYLQWSAKAYDFDKINEICKLIRARREAIDVNEQLQEELKRAQQEIQAAEADSAAGCTCSCGYASSAGAKFCIRCGKKIEACAPASGLDARRDSICACGNPIPPSAQFCTKCGARVAAVTDVV